MDTDDPADIDPTGVLTAMLDNPHLAHEIAAAADDDDTETDDGATDLHTPDPWDDQ